MLFRHRTKMIGLFCLLLSLASPYAATVYWKCSTNGAPWVEKDPMQTVPWDNDNTNLIQVKENELNQEYDGHGGCINEVGWKVLNVLPQSTRDSVVKLIFDSISGCNFTNCRVPIGANDYSLKPGFTLDDTPGDYAMDKFNINQDKLYHIPFIKAGMAYQPNLKIWGSPWSPPTWMKTSGNSLTSGSIKSDAQTFTALALYFAKAVKAYQQEGLHYYAVCPQNEPFWGGGAYPVCQWTGAQMRDFIRDYLGPRFKKDDINGEIWLGTLNGSDDAGSRTLTADCFKDSIANSYCTGAGYQYSPDQMLATHNTYADKRLMETETPCGGNMSGTPLAPNDWGYAEGNDATMRIHYLFGCNAYMQWNIVLDREGKNWGNWSQNAMITVDTVTKKVTYNPQFYQVRHYSYIKPGAYRISTAGTFTSVIAYRNPDGENILVATNATGSAVTTAINFNGQKIKPTLPAHSFNTFRVAGTPIPPVSPYSKMEAEKFSKQSGILIRPCNGGSGVTMIHNNDWTVYHNIDFGTLGAKAFQAQVSGAAGGSIEVHIDSCNGPAAGVCNVAASSAWGSVTCPITGVNGKHTLYLKFKGGADAGKLFDFDWFQFTQETSSVQARPGLNPAENNPRIVLCNGLKSPVTHGTGKIQSSFTAYDLTGKVIYNGGNALNKNSRFGKGIYIVKNIGK
jgi:glucosylceramidase